MQSGHSLAQCLYVNSCVWWDDSNPAKMNKKYMKMITGKALQNSTTQIYSCYTSEDGLSTIR